VVVVFAKGDPLTEDERLSTRLEISLKLVVKRIAVYNPVPALSMTMGLDQSVKVLALDTSTHRESVALLRGHAVVAELRLCSLQTHSARLLRSIQFLLDSSGWALTDLQLVAAGIGPGSFTGIRIGVATALGLAQTLEIPFAGVSGLDALAQQVAFVDGRVGVVMDAQREEVYYGEFMIESGRIRRVRKACLLRLSELQKEMGRRQIYMVGDGLSLFAGRYRRSAKPWPRPIETDLFLATAIGRVALARRHTWRTGDRLWSDPLYIRPPDALRARHRER
jgi:tRNA threonylcarbamoyladenosine biosynthesis protein TsaB